MPPSLESSHEHSERSTQNWATLVNPTVGSEDNTVELVRPMKACGTSAMKYHETTDESSKSYGAAWTTDCCQCTY